MSDNESPGTDASHRPEAWMDFTDPCMPRGVERTNIVDADFAAMELAAAALAARDRRPLSAQVAELEERARLAADCQCATVRSTLLANFGPEGRVLKGLADPKAGLLEMLMAVLRHYARENDNAE